MITISDIGRKLGVMVERLSLELFRKASELQDEIIRYKSGPKRD